MGVEEGSAATKVIRSTPSTPHFPPTCPLVYRPKPITGDRQFPKSRDAHIFIHRLNSNFALKQDFGQSFPWTCQLRAILIQLVSQEIAHIPHSHTSYIVSQQLLCVRISSSFRRFLTSTMPAPVPLASPWGPQTFPSTWTLSEWQRTTRQDTLVNHGKDDPLPDKVDIVVIGSGLAGMKLIFFHYLFIWLTMVCLGSVM